MKQDFKVDRIEISDEKRVGTEKINILEDKEKAVTARKEKEEIDFSKEYLSENLKSYKVNKYANNCEDHNQILYVLPLIKSTPKFILYIILNIFTVGIINLFIAWFPKLNLYLYYKVTTLEEATNFGIFSKDNELSLVKKKVIIFPEIDDPENSVIKKFNLNINYEEKKAIMFEYKLFDYIYMTQKEYFTSMDYKIKDKQVNIIEEYSSGLNPNEIELMKSLFGICNIDIRVNSVGKILLDELTDPFYLFQLYSVILWYCTNYYYYASVIVILTVLSLVLSVHGTYKNLKQLQKISRYSCQVKVYRKNENNEYMEDPIEMSSENLVPGDLFEIPEDGLAMPCDAILIDGSVIINESMLTGESTPVIKVRMPGTMNMFNTKEPDSDKYILFGGTKVVQKRKLGKGPPLGIVFQTGFKTFKGNLINAILYPKPEDDSFSRDSVKYIIFMSILCVVGFAISLKFLIVDAELTDKEIVEKFLDLFTTAVPPSLPACISVGITYSLSRLKKKGVFCIQRDNVNKAGNVNILIFDKTGTLTEDHLDISGYVSVKINENNEFEFLPFTSSLKSTSDTILEHFKKKLNEQNYKNKNKDLLQYFTECSACCHCLTYVKDNLVGDPIDVKMFEALGWYMKENDTSNGEHNLDPLVLNYITPEKEEGTDIRLQNNDNILENLKGKYALGIVKRFDFSSKLQRMTTISKNVNENYFKAFCKGSPEKVKDLCKPATIPLNYDNILNQYTSKGYRVLAMAAKGLKMDFQQSQTISREDVEKNMIFLGLLIVKNKLKEKTKDSLTKYDQADLRMLMATGDNILTAICVSRECNLIKQNRDMFSCELEKGQNDKEILKWHKIEGNEDDKDVSSDEGLNDNSGQLTKRQEMIDLTNDKSMNISLDELYPPEKIASDYKPKISFEEKAENTKKNNKSTKLQLVDDDNNNKNDNGVNDLYNKDHQMNTSRITNKTKELTAFDVNEEDSPLYQSKSDNFGIAITGPVFEKIFKLNERYIKNKDPKLKLIHQSYRLILKNGRVFARMAPEHKALLVEAFKKEGFTTLMCGDGANDCAALRTATVGVSLSPEEASIAAGFTSQIPDVSCIYELLREGKCSLTTSIQTFKYMMLYSLIQFICVTLLMIYISYLTDFQFLVSDLFIIFPLEWFLAMTHPHSDLTYEQPVSALLSFPVISSILIQTILVFVFQFVGYQILKKHYDFENICDFDDNDDPLPCHENTIIFLIAHFQYLTAALAFSVSKPFRQPIYKNWPLMIYLALIYFYSIWITINCDDWSMKLFGLYDLKYRGEEEEEEEEGGGDGAGEEDEEEEYDDIIPGGKNMKYYVLLICGINMVVNIFFEWFIMKYVNKLYAKKVIRDYKKEVEKEKLIDTQQKADNKEYEPNNKEVQIFKYQRIYFYDRRKRNKKKNQENKNNDVNIYSSSRKIDVIS